MAFFVARGVSTGRKVWPAEDYWTLGRVSGAVDVNLNGSMIWSVILPSFLVIRSGLFTAGQIYH